MKVEWQRTGSVGKSLGDDILSSARVGRKAGRRVSSVNNRHRRTAGWPQVMAQLWGLMKINEAAG